MHGIKPFSRKRTHFKSLLMIIVTLDNKDVINTNLSKQRTNRVNLANTCIYQDLLGFNPFFSAIRGYTTMLEINKVLFGR